MTQEDTLYRAFGELYKALSNDPGTAKILRSVAKAQFPDSVTVVHNVCRVEDDWLSAIERGLVYIGKAIEEDRQFIRSDGEVRPIEKVRRVSRESVQHLSRHSDYITRKQDQKDIMPDKLYTVERYSDYAVYENKFLYLLLIKIRDFTEVRYNAVLSAYKEYRGEYKVQKKVLTATRRLTFDVSLTDEQDDAVSAPADRECAEAIERMHKILQSVAFYLGTPLMIEVSRAHKISPKITKTNALLMDKNFREALELYEFLIAYESDGYCIERKVDKLDPVPEKFKEEFAVPAVLSAFLVYEHGLKLEEYLEEQFQKEEEIRREAKQAELARALKALKKRIEEYGGNTEEYMLMLEERNAALEEDSKRLAEAKLKIAALEGEIEKLKSEISALQAEIADLNARIEEIREEMKRAEEEHLRQIEALEKEFAEKEQKLKEAHAEEIAALKEAAQKEYEALKNSMEEEISRLKAANAKELNDLREAHKAKLAALQEEREAESARMKAKYEAMLADGLNKVKASEQTVQRTLSELEKTQKELALSEKEKTVISARLTATRKEFGLLTEADDFTTEAGFNALEHEFETLGRLVREEWTGVKKILRKEFYGGIRAEMKKKKARKSKEYDALSEEIKSRGARGEDAARLKSANGANGADGGKNSQTGKIENADDSPRE